MKIRSSQDLVSSGFDVIRAEYPKVIDDAVSADDSATDGYSNPVSTNATSERVSGLSACLLKVHWIETCRVP